MKVKNAFRIAYFLLAATAVFAGVMAYLAYFDSSSDSSGTATLREKLAATGAALADAVRPQTRTIPHKPGKLVVAYSGDIVGSLDPCGCTQPAMGGLARRASVIKDMKRKKPEVPFLIVETGNAMKPGDNLDDPASRWAMEALNELGTHAVNLTLGDLRRLNRVAEKKQVPDSLATHYVASRIQAAPSGFPTRPYTIQTVKPQQGEGEVRVGILGVSEESGEGSGAPSMVTVEQALRTHLPEVDRQSQVVVLLTRLADDRLVTLARTFPAIDVIINGSAVSEGREFPKVGNTVMVESAHRGVALGMLELEWDASGRLTNSKNQLIPLPPFIQEDPQLARIAEKGHQESIDFLESEARKTPPIVSPSMFAGASSCKECHEQAYAAWAKSGHAHAIDKLKPTRDHFNSACVECHVTGWGEGNRGFVNIVSTPQLANVQCEACHGVAVKHSQRPAQFHPGAAERFKMPVKKEFCLRCHTPENSPRFQFEEYWPKIKH